MYGVYQTTVRRNLKTHETTFWFASETEGRLLCHGVIPLYTKNMPLEIQGYMRNNCFEVLTSRFPHERQRDVIRILETITHDLTEAQKEKVAKLTNNDLFLFVKTHHDAKHQIKNAIKHNRNSSVLAHRIYKRIKRLNENEKLTKQLMELGVSIENIDTFIKKEVTLEMLQNDPYKCSLDNLIDFYSAEKIAKKMLPNLHAYTTKRLLGLIKFALQSLANQGSTTVSLTSLTAWINKCVKGTLFPTFKFTEGLVLTGINLLNRFCTIHLIDGKAEIYINYIWGLESKIIRNMKRLQASRQEMISSPDVSKIEREENITYNAGQKEAAKIVTGSGIKILTGPAGTGKTAVLKMLIRLFEDAYPNEFVQLAATTGRASQVMSEATGRPALTIHKLLDLRPFGEEGLAKKDFNNPIEAKMIIVDEISMCDLSLFSHLLDAVQSGALLLLVGDEHQLQSVGYGNILEDMIDSNCIPIFRLKKIMRQSGMIVENATKINNGDKRILSDSSFQMHYFNDTQTAQQKLLSHVNLNTQVLSPIKSGLLGVDELNYVLQKKLNPYATSTDSSCIEYGNDKYYLNDKIIMTRTRYEKNYFNGDIGIITNIIDAATIEVNFKRKSLILTEDDFSYIKLAYVITIHKSQGSEFEHVVIVLPMNFPSMLTRRLLYTAVTRAKQSVALFTVQEALNKAIDNATELKRHTLFTERCKEALSC